MSNDLPNHGRVTILIRSNSRLMRYFDFPIIHTRATILTVRHTSVHLCTPLYTSPPRSRALGPFSLLCMALYASLRHVPRLRSLGPFFVAYDGYNGQRVVGPVMQRIRIRFRYPGFLFSLFFVLPIRRLRVARFLFLCFESLALD